MIPLKLSNDEVKSHFYAFLKKRRLYRAWQRGLKANRFVDSEREFLAKNSSQPRLLIGGAFIWSDMPIKANYTVSDKRANHKLWREAQQEWMTMVNKLNNLKTSKDEKK